ncbi:MAG: hypothetical protein ACI4W7_02615 [Candidatus Spyradenecus sp.]
MTTWQIEMSAFDALVRAFSRDGRARLYMASARAVSNLCRGHIRQESRRRHATANRLGATPSNHFEQATLTASASAEEAHVFIALPGISRAFRALSIVPRRARAITLPIAPEAYGKKASELERDGWALFTAKSLRGLLMGKNKATGETKPLYKLLAKVSQPQDRTLLPSDNALAQATVEGLIRRLRAIAKE